MILSDVNEIKNLGLRGSKYFSNGIIFDTCVLLVYFLDKHVSLHPKNIYLIDRYRLKIPRYKVTCLNTIITNLHLSQIIITPHILAEFINRLKTDYKEDYKEIQQECLEDLKNFKEIIIQKNDLISQKDFLDYGNDISLVLASENHIKKYKFGSIASFDGRFIRNSFKNSDNNILAFDLETLQYFFA
jgi:hypothetical protein